MNDDKAPAPVADSMADWLVGWIEVVCTACGAAGRTRVTGNADGWVCPDCIRRAADRDRIAAEAALMDAQADVWVVAWLRKSGVTDREAAATWDRVPPPVRKALMRAGAQALLDGQVPVRGYGLSGPAGCGKTCGLVAWMRRGVAAVWRAQSVAMGTAAARVRRLAWVRWPEAVNRLRVTSTRDGGLDDCDRMLGRWADVAWLVLDDIGAERMRGGHGDDWPASQLDLLVDRRYNAGLPTWYTTNLAADEFGSRYGSRIVSRLCGDNPLWEVGGAPDLRLSGGG